MQANLFATYAEQATPKRQRPRVEKAPSKLDLKLAEKQRLSRAYRLSRAKENAEILTSEPRLRDFARYVRCAADADELIEAVQNSWLPAAPDQVRFMALRLVAARCDKLNRMAGFPTLDDPLPPETSCFFRVRAALGVR